MEDDEGTVTVDQNGTPRLKIPNPCVELPYTYLMTWYAMHCPSLMIVVQASEDFVSFIQKLECLSWQGGYMAAIRR